MANIQTETRRTPDGTLMAPFYLGPDGRRQDFFGILAGKTPEAAKAAVESALDNGFLYECVPKLRDVLLGRAGHRCMARNTYLNRIVRLIAQRGKRDFSDVEKLAVMIPREHRQQLLPSPGKKDRKGLSAQETLGLSDECVRRVLIRTDIE